MIRTVIRLALLGAVAGLVLMSGSRASTEQAIACNPYFPRPWLSVCDVACPVDEVGVFDNCP